MARDIVLVHGMSHGAWCWELLEPRLRRAGHRVFAVDRPGRGRRAHNPMLSNPDALTSILEMV